jgi:ADP-L-glycero-D-manno-heptose 6-epimerase
MIVVTGGAGFIGSNVVRSLNDAGIDDVVVVDDLEQPGKFALLEPLRIADYRDREEFLAAVERDGLGPAITAVIHLGACTDTTEHDGRYMMANNYSYSRTLFHRATERGVPFVYASSAAIYGVQGRSAVYAANEHPLNVYGYSKLLFDQYVRRNLEEVVSTVVGLRYFNVYGAGEDFKGSMASMPYQLHRQLSDRGVARLFEGTDGYEHGGQRRDFIHVDDVVRVTRFFADGPARQTIVNVGTGKSRSFKAIARTLIDLHGGGEIEYIPFPDSLEGKYQSFTEADLSGLRAAGFDQSFLELEVGLARSVKAWSG